MVFDKIDSAEYLCNLSKMECHVITKMFYYLIQNQNSIFNWQYHWRHVQQYKYKYMSVCDAWFIIHTVQDVTIKYGDLLVLEVWPQ